MAWRRDLAGLIRRRKFAIASGLGLIAVAGWLALWYWLEARWLAVDPVAGPLPRGSLLASFQRGFDDVGKSPDGRTTISPGDATTVRIEPGTGSRRDLFDRLACDIRLSRDGRTLAFGSDGGIHWIRPVEGGEAEQIPDFAGYNATWSPDGSAIISTALPQAHFDRIGFNGTWRFAVPGFQRSRVELPDTEAVVDWSRDGRWLLTMSSRDLAPGPRRIEDFPYAIYRMAPDGSDALRLSPLSAGMSVGARFSPDGRRVAYTHLDFGTKVSTVRTIGVDGTDPLVLAEAENANVRACWSPDGRSLVVKGFRDAFLIDADGTNRCPLGLRWDRRLNFDSFLPAIIDKGTDPRWIGAIEWVDLPGK